MPMSVRRLLVLVSLLFVAGEFAGGTVGTAVAQAVPSAAPDAVQLLKNYYRWINAKKYEGAFNIWEKRDDGSAANGQTLDQFKNGFRDTRSVIVRVGNPGEIEGAAGSNFIELPVDITAMTKTGKTQKFVGSYTFRSSNMADDKSWYIYSASVKKAK